MTITLAAVYAPIGFTAGLTGALFREFAFTLAGAVVISGIVALTMSPMMSARLLKRAASRAGSQRFVDRSFERLANWYERRARRLARVPAGDAADRRRAHRRTTGFLFIKTPIRTGAGGGPGRVLRHRQRAALCDHATTPSPTSTRFADADQGHPGARRASSRSSASAAATKRPSSAWC